MSFADHGAPVLYAVFLWWFSTGAILWLDKRSRGSFRLSMLGASVATALAVWAFVWSAGEQSVAGAVAAFTAAVVIWGWHEMSFLMGFITGPRTAPCPPDARGWTRFRLAAATLMWHELAIALTGVAMVALVWGQPNQVGVWTFVILWVMRLSAKLNIFFGVSQITEEFLPDHLCYLKTYFTKSGFNPFLPISILGATAVAGWLAWTALQPANAGFAAVGLSLLFAILALAILEHVLMAAPLPDTLLWRWALPTPAQPPAGPPALVNTEAPRAPRNGGFSR